MNRMKTFCAVVAMLVLPVAASSSTGWEIGVESVAPTGDFEEIAGGGGGLYAQSLIRVNDDLLATTYVGAIAYGGVQVFGAEFQWYGYPITVGGAYYINGVDYGGLFVKANVGLLYKIGTVEFLGQEEDETDTGYVLSPGVGWDFGKVNVTADYNLGNNDWTWFAIKVAYRFGQ